MRLKTRELCQPLFVVFILLLTANICWAQTDSTPKKRLRTPATVRGFIGGESQDHYVIRARKGQTMIVRISWRPEEDNTAGFSVSPTESDNGEPIAGRETNNGRRWRGRIPKTGDYLISVVAHPSAHYTLRVVVK